jgi:CheY-like chemotaxis protein
LDWITALVVEDDALVRLDLTESLQAAGYKTVEAAGADEAIAVLHTNADIRVVFMDIQMPGTMDGLALSHYVRKGWPPTIIVVGLGRCTPGEEKMAEGARFFRKPFAPQALGKMLAEIREQLAA